jgi:hypothetical protein
MEVMEVMRVMIGDLLRSGRGLQTADHGLGAQTSSSGFTSAAYIVHPPSITWI